MPSRNTTQVTRLKSFKTFPVFTHTLRAYKYFHSYLATCLKLARKKLSQNFSKKKVLKIDHPEMRFRTWGTIHQKMAGPFLGKS